MAATRFGGRVPAIVCVWLMTGCCCHKCRDTICVPVPETKTVTKTVYDENCKTICTPAGPCRAVARCLGHGCDGDDCATCGRPREIHRLLKKSEKEERCVTKCEPVTKCLVGTVESPTLPADKKTPTSTTPPAVIALPK